MDHDNEATLGRASRSAGLVGLVFLVLAVLSNNPPFYSDASNARMLHWVQAHPTALYVEGVRTAVMMVLMVGFLAVLMWRTGLRDPLRSGVWALLGASMAIDMVWAGVYYALAYSGQHEIGDTGVLTLATLAEQMTFTDGFLWGIAVLVVAIAALRARTLPAPVAWLGVVTAVVHVVGVPVQVAWTHDTEGLSGPLSAVTLLFWVLAVSLTLIIRPAIPRAVVDVSETQLHESGNTPR